MSKTFLGLIALMAAVLSFDGSGVLLWVRAIWLLCLLRLLARARWFLRRTTILLRLDHLVHVLHTLSETFSLFESAMARSKTPLDAWAAVSIFARWCVADRVQHVIRSWISRRSQATHFDSVSTVFIGRWRLHGWWWWCWWLLGRVRCICQRDYRVRRVVLLSYTWTFVPLSCAYMTTACSCIVIARPAIHLISCSLQRIFPISSLLSMMHIDDNVTCHRRRCCRRQVSCRLAMMLLMCLLMLRWFCGVMVNAMYVLLGDDRVGNVGSVRGWGWGWAEPIVGAWSGGELLLGVLACALMVAAGLLGY